MWRYKGAVFGIGQLLVIPSQFLVFHKETLLCVVHDLWLLSQLPLTHSIMHVHYAMLHNFADAI